MGDGSGPITISLPTASDTGRVYHIKNISNRTLTIDPFGTEQIEDENEIDLRYYNSVSIISDGSDWWVY